MKKVGLFRVLPKIVLWRRTARTDNPDTPQTHLTASDFHKYHSDTIRHPQYTSQTPPRHLRRTQGASRHQQTQTDASRRQQTYSKSSWQCLGLSEAVCLCLLVSVGVLCSLELSWGYLGGDGGCLMVSKWYLWKSRALKCGWGISGLSVLAVRSYNTLLA